MDEAVFRGVIEQLPELIVDQLRVTVDVRPGREDERWLNAYLVKG